MKSSTFTQKHALLVAAIALLTAAGGLRAQQPVSSGVILAPTNHPRLPRDLSQLWLAPEPGRARTPAQTAFVTAIKLEVDGNFARALPILQQPMVRQGPLANYAEYYTGLAQLRLGRLDEARRTFQSLQAQPPVGYLAEAVAFRAAESDETMGDPAAAVAVYEGLLKTRTINTEEVLMRLARAAKLSGNSEKASATYARVYAEYPLTDQALAAGAELANGSTPGGPSRYKIGLARAQRLFSAKQYGPARTEYESLRTAAQGDDRELVDLRIAECDHFLKRARNAKTALRPYIERASRQGEALFFYALASRELNEIDEYVKTAERIAADFPTSSWADDALNDLANYYIVHDEDEKADAVYRDLYKRFPIGHNAERAAWKIGWWAYRKGNDADVSRFFERAAFDFPRSDYRPMWLYWSGRAHDRAKETELATARYTLAVTDYSNSYYGRLAAKRLQEQGIRLAERRLIVDAIAPESGDDTFPDLRAVAIAPPPNAEVIRTLLALDLYDQAIDELHYAQKAWGNSSALEATLGWTFWQQGRAEKAMDQLVLYRAGMNAVKRAYPHYLAAGGEELPVPLLRMIFPVSYWDAIRKYAAFYNLDPYISAALIAQESTFVPDVRSYANAWGLTQLRPGTAMQYAKVLNLRYTPKLLTDPDANLRIGMKYFAEKIREFGAVHLALASYNAGERAVHRWVMERPGLPDDEFIDDIPYPETNNYVKKILGTAEDYRHLYGPGSVQLDAVVADAVPSASTAPAAAAPKVSPRPPAKKITPTRSAKKKTRKTA